MSKITFLVAPLLCIGRTDLWYAFAACISQQLNRPFTLDVAINHDDFKQRLKSADLIYCPPAYCEDLLKLNAFRPLCQPTNLYEEVAILASPFAQRKVLNGLDGCAVATVRKSYQEKLGRSLLKRKQINPARIVHYENWSAVVGSLLDQNIDYAIVDKHYLNQINGYDRKALSVLATSDTRKAFNMLAAGGQLRLRMDELQEAVLAMHLTPEGSNILKQLGTRRWRRVNHDSLHAMLKLLNKNYIPRLLEI